MAKRVNSHNTKSVILSNIPNFLSVSRIILTFVIIYMIFTDFRIATIIVVFAIAALTDWFDGQLARRFNWVSEFGRKADMIADRFLWMGTAAAFIVVFGLRGYLSGFHGILFLLTMTREVITAPFALIAFVSGKPIPHAIYVAKVTTFIQGFALPSLMLSIFYPSFMYLALPLSIACSILGFISAMYYIHDIKKAEQKNVRTKRRKN